MTFKYKDPDRLRLNEWEKTNHAKSKHKNTALYVSIQCVIQSKILSLLIFRLDDLSIADSGVLRSPIINVLLSV